MINEDISEEDLIVFKHPFTSIIAGPTQSSKTTIVIKILEFSSILIQPPPENIIYCYSIWQNSYDIIKSKLSNIKFHQGLIDFEEINKNERNLIIIDDLMEKCDNIDIRNLFTKQSHHMNTSVFFISQNLFPKEKHCRTISLNTHYLILTQNKRDSAQINVLARQVLASNPNALIESYIDAIKSPFGYLFLDFKPQSKFLIQTGILPTEIRTIYLINEKS